MASATGQVGTLPKTAKRPQPKGGSRKGVPNKATAQIKELILGALDDAGGRAYLTERALDPKTAAAFLGLVGKVLPLQVTGEGGGAIRFERIERVVVDPGK